MKRQSTELTKVFANHISGQGLISRIYKELPQLNNSNNNKISQIKMNKRSQVLVAYACNPRYLGGYLEDHGSRPAWDKQFSRPHLQNNQSKMDQRCGSNDRVLALQA
jgi:hypothetical protein